MKKVFCFIVGMNISGALCFAGDEIKYPNVSGQFYSDVASELSKDIQNFFQAALISPSQRPIEILIVPHAGYVYSGPVAAYGYKAVSLKKYNTVVIIALSHFTDLEGFAVWPEGSFMTPLGSIDVDKDFSKRLMEDNSKVSFLPQAFQREHSLEVELPFLQEVFKNFKIVPLLTGRPSLQDCRFLAEVLNRIIGKRNDVLVVISSDMSHYHDDATAKTMDARALELIKKADIDNFWNKALAGEIEMCNFSGVATALFLAQLKGINDIEVLRYANSADVTGDTKRVVGYSAVAFYKEGDEKMEKQNIKTDSLSAEQKKKLLMIARKTIETYVEKGEVVSAVDSDPRLSLKEGAFVTLHRHGQLRGCIGNIIGQEPLYLTVRDMAIAAATRDPRFRPLSADELRDVEIEISVLSVPQKIDSPERIVMGQHGVIVSRGAGHHGVFLPQVATETGWSKEEFLSQLCAQKADLPSDAWKDPQTDLEIFTADVFSEKNVK